MAGRDAHPVDAGDGAAGAAEGLPLGVHLALGEALPLDVVPVHEAHQRHYPGVTRGELERLAAEFGLDAVGAAPAEPYAETERHIRERRARGLFADLKFTMARPEESCHPETLLPGARTVVSAALCY